MQSHVNFNTLDWQYTPTTNGESPSKEFKESFKPRVKPFMLFNAVSSDIIEIPPTEYLIGQSNGLGALGVAKNRNHSQPLTMQFGNWKSMHGKKLYVGCTVVVKSYAVLLEKYRHALRSVIPSNNPTKEMIFKGRINAKTQAVEWAIISKPPLEPHLGYVTEFWTSKYKLEGDYFFLGRVYDQESYVQDILISNEQWPFYIKKAVPIGDPVVINRIKIEEPHRVLPSNVGFKTMLPDRNDLPFDTERNNGETIFWVDSVDTRLESID